MKKKTRKKERKNETKRKSFCEFDETDSCRRSLLQNFDFEFIRTVESSRSSFLFLKFVFVFSSLDRI